MSTVWGLFVSCFGTLHWDTDTETSSWLSSSWCYQPCQVLHFSSFLPTRRFPSMDLLGRHQGSYRLHRKSISNHTAIVSHAASEICQGYYGTSLVALSWVGIHRMFNWSSGKSCHFSAWFMREASATSSFNAGGGFAALFARPEDSHWTFGAAQSKGGTRVKLQDLQACVTVPG